MPAPDFLTNVETAFLAVFQTNSILAKYNWQRWDNDKQVELPRGTLGLRSFTDPQEGPYQRVGVLIAFEGRPITQKFSVVVNELKTLFQTIDTSDLDDASGNTVKFFGKADNVSEERRVAGGLRTWIYGFDIYAMPLV